MSKKNNPNRELVWSDKPILMLTNLLRGILFFNHAWSNKQEKNDVSKCGILATKGRADDKNEQSAKSALLESWHGVTDAVHSEVRLLSFLLVQSDSSRNFSAFCISIRHSIIVYRYIDTTVVFICNSSFMEVRLNFIAPTSSSSPAWHHSTVILMVTKFTSAENNAALSQFPTNLKLFDIALWDVLWLYHTRNSIS